MTYADYFLSASVALSQWFVTNLGKVDIRGVSPKTAIPLIY